VAINHHVSAYVDLILSDMPEPRVIVDATLGNGRDTLKLMQRFPRARLYAFDIQKRALEISRQRLLSHGITEGFTFYCASHEAIPRFVDRPVDLCLFNLGYLPGGDKKVHTTPRKTIQGIEGALSILSPGGRILVTLYPGSLPGKIESIEVEAYVRGLDQKKTTVMSVAPLNQKNQPPYLLVLSPYQG